MFLTGPAPKIQLGWGSRNGLECINLGEFSNNNMEDRFKLFQWTLLDFYKDPDTPQDVLMASGWRKGKDRRVFSCWCEREYAEMDSEHILCKVWLAILHSNPCRNISKAPRLSTKHSYPLFDVDEWQEDLTQQMRDITDAFEKLGHLRKNTNYRYPALLLFPSEAEEVESLVSR